MTWKKGWIESRTAKGSTVMVDYRVLTVEEMVQLKNEPQYSRTTIQNSDLARMMAHLMHCTPEDLLAGHLLFCSQEPLKSGLHLEMKMQIADFDCPMHFLVEAHSVVHEDEMKEMVFMTRIKIMAAHKGDMDFLTRVIEGRKKKQAEG
jgi:hypothetical protein